MAFDNLDDSDLEDSHSENSGNLSNATVDEIELAEHERRLARNMDDDIRRGFQNLRLKPPTFSAKKSAFFTARTN